MYYLDTSNYATLLIIRDPVSLLLNLTSPSLQNLAPLKGFLLSLSSQHRRLLFTSPAERYTILLCPETEREDGRDAHRGNLQVGVLGASQPVNTCSLAAQSPYMETKESQGNLSVAGAFSFCVRSSTRMGVIQPWPYRQCSKSSAVCSYGRAASCGVTSAS